MRLTLSLLACLLSCSAAVRAETALIDRYAGAGLPPLNSAWHGEDYAKALEVFASGRAPLPRMSEEDGAAVLRRLTSVENLSAYADHALPARERLGDFIEMLQDSNGVINLYVNAVKEKDRYAPELAALMAFQLRECALGVDLMDEMIPTIPKDDSYAARMASLQKVNVGITTLFMGAEATLSEDNGFGPAQRAEVLVAMSETLPRSKRAFSPEYRVELSTRLQADRKQFASADAGARIDAMQKELAH